MNENQNINNSKSNKKIFILVGGLLILLVIVICVFAVVNKDGSNNSDNNNQENNINGSNNDDSGDGKEEGNGSSESKFRQVTVGNLSFVVSGEFKNGGSNNEVYQMYNYMTDTEFCKLTVTQNELSSTITPKNYYKTYYDNSSVLIEKDINNIKTEKINNTTWNTIEVDGYGDYTDYYYLYIDKDNNAYDIHYEIYSGKTKCDSFFKDIKGSLKMK